MEVAIVLLYVVVGVCVLSCVGMGIVAILSWMQDRNRAKERDEELLQIECDFIYCGTNWEDEEDSPTYEHCKIRSEKNKSHERLVQEHHSRKPRTTMARRSPPKPQTKARF